MFIDKYLISGGDDGRINIIDTKSWNIHHTYVNIDERSNKKCIIIIIDNNIV